MKLTESFQDPYYDQATQVSMGLDAMDGKSVVIDFSRPSLRIAVDDLEVLIGMIELLQRRIARAGTAS